MTTMNSDDKTKNEKRSWGVESGGTESFWHGVRGSDLVAAIFNLGDTSITRAGIPPNGSLIPQEPCPLLTDKSGERNHLI